MHLLHGAAREIKELKFLKLLRRDGCATARRAVRTTHLKKTVLEGSQPGRGCKEVPYTP